VHLADKNWPKQEPLESQQESQEAQQLWFNHLQLLLEEQQLWFNHLQLLLEEQQEEAQVVRNPQQAQEPLQLEEALEARNLQQEEALEALALAPLAPVAPPQQPVKIRSKNAQVGKRMACAIQHNSRLT